MSFIPRYLICTALCACILIAGCSVPGGREPDIISGTTGDLAVHFIDVGQGDSALVRSRSGEWIMIDAGGKNEYIYDDVLSPYFKYRRIKKIKTLIITHGHLDHYAGVLRMIESGVQIEKIMAASPDSAETEYKRLVMNIKKHGVKFETARAGNEIYFNGAVLNFLWPDPDFIKNSDFISENDRSVVFKLSYMGKTFLFSGDISEKVENLLIKSKCDLSSTVYKAAHHGSKTSNSEGFINAVKPETTYISSGYMNRFGHPHIEALKRLESASNDVIISSKTGAVSFELKNEKCRMLDYAGNVIKLL